MRVQQWTGWVGLAGFGFFEQLVHVSDRGASLPEVANDACAMKQMVHLDWTDSLKIQASMARIQRCSLLSPCVCSSMALLLETDF